MDISPAFLSDLKSRISVVDVVSHYIKDLKPSGAGEFTACCPFHSEKSASFTVSSKKDFYHCFGCGAHGDGIGFIMEHTGKKFRDAVEELASLAGVQVPKQGKEKAERTEEEKNEARRFAKAYAAIDFAQAAYVAELKKSVEAQSYLLERGVTQDSIDRFELGYAPDAWNTVTGSRDHTKEALEDAGLSTRSDNAKRPYDRFRDRIMFPIKSGKGKTIGFGGRGIHGQDPKYLNSPESLLFSKGSHLYGLTLAMDAICKSGRVYVVEGYMDVLMLAQYGVYNVVASLGTSVTDAQMRRMFNLCSHITFCMDGDNAGRKAAWRAAENILPLLDDKHKVDFMFMPDGMDPDDFIQAHGKDGFEAAAKSARTLTDYMLDVFVRYTDMSNSESLAKYLSKTNEYVEKIQNGVIKLAFQKRIAELSGISLDTLLSMLKEEKGRSTPTPSAAPEAVETTPVVTQTPYANVEVEISVAAKMLGITVLRDHRIAPLFELDYLSRFLSAQDKEMLFPLIAYLSAVPNTTDEALLTSLSFNKHAKLIASLLSASHLVGDKFDATVEAKAVIDGFRKMERIWQIVRESSNVPGSENKN